jgi:hypothetical protein
VSQNRKLCTLSNARRVLKTPEHIAVSHAVRDLGPVCWLLVALTRHGAPECEASKFANP